MDRLEFLKAAIIGTSAILAAGDLNAATDEETIILYQGYIAGYRHHQGATIEKFLNLNDKLAMIREPSNAFDCKAISIWFDSIKLGYISSINNTVICNLIDHSIPLKAYISCINCENVPWERIKISVTVNRNILLS